MNPQPAQSAQPAPLDGKTFAIGALSVTACVLLVGFILIATTPRQALAIGQVDRAGDYVMLTQQISNSIEVVCVIDAAVRQMNVYAVQESSKQIRILQSVPLDKLPKTPEQERRAKLKGP